MHFAKCHQTVIRGRCRKQFGLSLVEVLVTLVVVALGLPRDRGTVGFGSEVGALAENRSNSVVYANNIIDRMRANIANAASM